ncbi:hypothetical protein H4Q26_003072 [Puccinia striiformis f. sp. tritici PST-130]|nr:hypothetical protein H4Q26_003072 [Puccinia striiformis f. sp. tritici PST-130]
MARFKLDVQKRQHRERSQPLHRSRLGLLEKHSDYVKRAKDYNSKKDRLQKLKLKASLKNHDEFYFKMINSKTVKDVHYNFNQTILLLIINSAIEENKIIKMKERLGPMIIRVQSEGSSSSSSELQEQAIQLLNQSVSATHAKNTTNSDRGGSELDDDNTLVKPSKKTSLWTQLKKKPDLIRSSSSTSSSSKSIHKEKSRGKFTEEFSDGEDQLTQEPEKHIKKLMAELQTRLTRLRVLQTAERESELKKSLMGKGSKFLKFRPPSTTKSSATVNGGRDLSWYDKLDRNQIIEDDLERERLDKLNSGIKTGAQVWKWKQERKK